MPKEDLPPAPVFVDPETFTLSDNDEMVEQQATVTYKLKAHEGQMIGTGGEQLGFAKYQISETLTQLVEERKAITQANEERDKLIGTLQDGPEKQELIHQKQNANNDSLSLLEILKNKKHLPSQLFEDPKKIRSTHDMGLLTRSVASTAVDRVLGTQVVAEERFGIAPNGKVIGISVQADGVGIQSEWQPPGKDQKLDAILDVDYSHPDIQRGLFDLEINDYITGQLDRHPGNIFIDPKSNRVTGIDNDLAFPEVNLPTLEKACGLDYKGVSTLPRLMHEETAKKILATSPTELAEALENLPRPENCSPLSPKAIQGAVDRLQELQHAIHHPEMGLKVVKEFNEATFKETLAAQKVAFNEKMARKGRETAFETAAPSELLDPPKISQLGFIQQYKIGFEGKIAIQEKDIATMRPAESAGKAMRDPDVAAYLQQEAKAKESLKASPELIENANLRKAVETAKGEISALKKTVSALDHKEDKLAHPQAATRLKEAFLGKSQRLGKMEKTHEQLTQALQKIKSLEKQMDAALTEAVAPLRSDLEAILAAKRGSKQESVTTPKLSPPSSEEHHHVADDLRNDHLQRRPSMANIKAGSVLDAVRKLNHATEESHIHGQNSVAEKAHIHGPGHKQAANHAAPHV